MLGGNVLHIVLPNLTTIPSRCRSSGLVQDEITLGSDVALASRCSELTQGESACEEPNAALVPRGVSEQLVIKLISVPAASCWY